MKKLALAAAALLAPLAAHAQGSKTFDFKDPKETNAVSLTIDAVLEPVVGWAGGVTGYCTVDPAHPEKTVGRIEVAVDSITFSNSGYSNSVRGYGLQNKKFPKIVCAFKKILSGKKVSETRYVGEVLVDFTIKGVTRPLTVPLDIRYFPKKARQRDGINDGDLVVVRSKFAVSRKAFGVAQEVPEEVCSDAVEVGVALVGTEGAPKPDKPAPKPAEFSVNVDGKSVPLTERMAFHKVPGCSVALVKDFKVTWVKHFGDTGNDAKTPIDGGTLFPAGQMSEPVAHALALKLADAKIIDLDRDVNDYLTRWKTPKSGEPVTVRQLLQNRAGFTLQKYMGHDPTKPLSTLVETLADARLDFTPGTNWRRAAENANVLQLVLEDATKKPLSAILNEAFGNPQSLYMAFPPSESYTRFAKGFDEDGTPVAHGGRAYPELAAAGLWTSAAEYGDFLGALMACAAGKADKPWSRTSAKVAFESVVPVRQDGPDVQGEATSFGFAERDGKRYYFRGGNAQGYYCQGWLNPEKGSAIVVFTNRQLAWKLSNEIRDTLFPELYE